MARRDLTGAVDFAYLEGYAAGDQALVDEVLGLFQEQAALWGPMLDPGEPNWRDAAHTVKGAARGVGAFALGNACEAAEAGTGSLGAVREALDAALADIAAYAHEQMLQSIRSPARD
jgi:HPt (histidine-containing phosphotransfer) domain-containing protein